jgi:hypothetical protein
MKKPKIGDIIEIPTKIGLAYAQYTHDHPRRGALLRVFDQIFESRPADWERVSQGVVRYPVFFPLTAAVRRGIFEIVGHSEVTGANKIFPLFRDGVPEPGTTKVSRWWLWDGEKDWWVGELTPEQGKLPIDGIWTDLLLVERIEGGWVPGTDSI